MRAVLLFVSILFVYSAIGQSKAAPKTTAKSTAGYQIGVKITPLKNSMVYLYNYYGKDRFQIADSTRLNEKSEGVFKGTKKLAGGIYIFVTDKRVRLFDFLMDAGQHFSIAADTSQPDKVLFTGSKDNTLYQDYAKYLAGVGPKLNALKQQYNASRTKEDSASLQLQMKAVDKGMDDYRQNVIQSHPESMLTAFFNAMKTPPVPQELPTKPDGSKDSTYPYWYVKDHYWDDVDFSDDRLVRTPFFEPKLDDYYKYYVSPEPDSIIKEVKYMLLSAREGKEMYRYLLAKFTNKYMNPEVMGQDKVFVYLFENHFLKGDTTILNEKDKEVVFKRGWSLIANQIGEPAPALDLVDLAGKSSPLSRVNAKYTFVVFWDPNCGHCKETVPRIDSFYRAKWKALGVRIYAVNVDEATLKAWDEFIKKNNLQEWTHAYQTKAQRDADVAAARPNYRQLYDVFKTPTLYLLDEQKRIIAKALDVNGFDEVITRRSNAKK